MKQIFLVFFVLIMLGILNSCKTLNTRTPIADVGDIYQGQGAVELVNACYDMQKKTLIPKPIYGRDDRLDCEKLPKEFYELTKTSVALVDKNNLVLDSSGYYKIKYPSTYGRTYQLCEGERFFEQPILAFCSGSHAGVLTKDGVKKSMIVTAGHCLKSKGDCTNTLFLHGFTLQGKKHPSEYRFHPDQVFKCEDIIEHKLDDFESLDHAMLVLDRTINAPSVKFDGIRPKIGDNIMLIGYPNGLPMKVTLNGKVYAEAPHYVTADTDSYGGNSGSPAFNMVSKAQVSILVRGYTDHEFVESKSKNNVKVAKFKSGNYHFVIEEQYKKGTRVKNVMCRRELHVPTDMFPSEHLSTLEFITELFPSLIQR